MITLDVDLRPFFGTARAQHQRPTCLAFAASDAHALVHSRPAQELSAEYAHYRACQHMPLFQPEQATSTPAMFKALEQDGQPIEAAWPYSPSLPLDVSTYAPPSVTGLFRHPGQVLQGLGDAEAWLRAGWPVILGIALTASFYLIKSLQTVEPDPDLNVFGYHAVLAVGLLQRADGAAFLIRNTWGLTWGNQSHAILSSGYLQPRLKFVGGFRA